VEQATTLTLAPGEKALTDARARILEEIFDTHQARLYRLARRLSSDPEEAKDLVQEAFLRLVRHDPLGRVGVAGAEAWLVRVLVNLCRDRMRRERVRGRRGHADADHVGVPAAAEPAAIARATVAAALARLPARRRAVVVLHEIEERDTGEIAKLLGLSRVTVRWHLHAARKQLRIWLGGKEASHD
jgi:RNA polymerase sigma-70 factor (ECF subfamily)